MSTEQSASSSQPEQRVCARCGQKIPPKAMLVASEGGHLLCLACQIKAGQERGLRH